MCSDRILRLNCDCDLPITANHQGNIAWESVCPASTLDGHNNTLTYTKYVPCSVCKTGNFLWCLCLHELSTWFTESRAGGVGFLGRAARSWELWMSALHTTYRNLWECCKLHPSCTNWFLCIIWPENGHQWRHFWAKMFRYRTV